MKSCRRTCAVVLASVIAACTAPAPLWAQQPAFAKAFDPARVSAYCSDARGFGQAFGGSRLEGPGAVASPFGNRRVFTPRGDFAPFNDFKGGFTPKSNALHTIEATAWYATATEATAAFDAIHAAMAASGQFASVELEEREQADSGFVSQKVTYLLRPPSDPPAGVEVVLRLAARVQNPSTVVMECMDQGIYHRAAREAF